MQIVTASWTQRRGWDVPLPEGWDCPDTLVLAFGPSSMLDDPGPLPDLVRRFPTAVLLGCSTSGEISGSRLLDDSLTVAVVKFERTRLAVVSAAVVESDSSTVGRELGRQLRGFGDDLVATLLLSDGTLVNGSALAAGLAVGTGRGSVASGGLAGDGSRFVRTWVLVDGTPRTGYAVAVGLYGSHLDVGYGSDGGWSVLGPERVVTRSEGNVLLELDGQPALDLYRTYLGDRAAGLPATALLFPLSVRMPGAGERELVRTVLGIDDERCSMTFAGDIPEGARATLMRSTSNRLVEAAYGAARAAALPDDAPALALAVSCVGRRLYLGQRTEEELEAVVESLPAGVTVVGFYSYGELSPVLGGGCDLHNQTMTLTVLKERAA